MKLYQKITVGNEKEIRIFEHPVLTYGCDNYDFNDAHSYEKYINILPHKGIREEFFDNILQQLSNDTDYDDIYICRMAAIGDSYMLTLMITNWLKKNNSKRPIVVGLKDTTEEAFKLLKPDIICKKISFNKRKALEIFYNDTENKGFEYKNKRFFSYINKQIIFDIHKNIANCFQRQNFESCSFLKNLESYYAPLSGESNIPQISDYTKINALQLVQSTGLNIDNFIFISPDASSNEKYDKEFWLDLIDELKRYGYDIYINSTDPEVDIPNTVKNIENLETTYYLAQRAKAIISLRSGLNDFLSTVNIPQHILYTKFACNDIKSAEENILAFSLKYLPNVNTDNIYEYNTEELTKQEIISLIMKGL